MIWVDRQIGLSNFEPTPRLSDPALLAFIKLSSTHIVQQAHLQFLAYSDEKSYQKAQGESGALEIKERSKISEDRPWSSCLSSRCGAARARIGDLNSDLVDVRSILSCLTNATTDDDSGQLTNRQVFLPASRPENRKDNFARPPRPGIWTLPAARHCYQYSGQ